MPALALPATATRRSRSGTSSYYVNAVPHHPQYRAQCAENLKRELQRVPLGRGGTGVWPVARHGQDGRATPDLWVLPRRGESLRTCTSATRKSSRIRGRVGACPGQAGPRAGPTKRSALLTSLKTADSAERPPRNLLRPSKKVFYHRWARYKRGPPLLRSAGYLLPKRKTMPVDTLKSFCVATVP